MPEQAMGRDVVLSPTQYAFIQDTSTGHVKVWVGPKATTLTQNDRLVIWTGKKFQETPDINQARMNFKTATEGQYVVLTDPAKGNHKSHPAANEATLATELDVGKHINIPGPVSFALWPGQSAEPIDGHRLSHDEYLLVQVYEPDVASKEQGIEETVPEAEKAAPGRRQEKYKIGERRVIKGTEKSFYIPPTGIDVLPEVKDQYVRKAAVIKRLEYVCFSRGHIVTMAHSNRAKRYIENVKEGDELLGYNEETGISEPTTVIAKSQREVTDLLRIHFASGRSVQCTPEHPFHVEKRGGWVKANDLCKGDEISEHVTAVRHHNQHAPAGYCQECGEWYPALQLDHIAPRGEGGINTLENLRWLCPPCHEVKTTVERTRMQKKRFAENPELVSTQLFYGLNWDSLSEEEQRVHIERWHAGRDRWLNSLSAEELEQRIAAMNSSRLAEIATPEGQAAWSKQRKDWWASLSEQEKTEWCENVGSGVRQAYANLTPGEKRDRQAVSRMYLDSLSPERLEKLIASRVDGVRRWREELSGEALEEHRKKLSDARRDFWSGKSPEERSAIVRKGHDTRRERRAEVVENGDPIIAIERSSEPTMVYNIQCSPHQNYFVRGLLVHNCLVSEQGSERYEEGPAVVFPEPDEEFVTERGQRTYRKLDLSAQSGLYIKVTEDYPHDGEKPIQAFRGNEMVEVKKGDILLAGDELFVTGKDTPLYMPRVEHFVIEYGENKKKHHAIALPAGKGRYVLDRVSDGGVNKVVGPRMYLPDPRTEVVVRRILDAKTVGLWYPGNLEAQRVNQELAGQREEKGEQYLSSEPVAFSMAPTGQAGSLAKSSGAVTGGLAAGRIKRGTEYTPTRTITLEDKYEGPPQISIWPGYAVMVMDPTGNRHVEEGPVDLLLEYHETLMALTLSTGRPKGTGSPLGTVYLRTLNNAVGDRITVETRDLVPVTIELSLRVNFEADNEEERQRWFAVEDYVALLTDSVRSRLRHLAKQHNVQDFTTNTIDLIRDFLLGTATEEAKRPGYAFSENGMRLYDVEVLDVSIQHHGVKQMLDMGTVRSVENAIRLSQEQEETEQLRTLEALKRERIAAREQTAEEEKTAKLAAIVRDSEASLAAIASQLEESKQIALVSAVDREDARLQAEEVLEIQKDRDVVELARNQKETEFLIQRLQALQPQFIEALRMAGEQTVAERLVEHLGPAALAAGTTTAELWHRAFAGTPLESVMGALTARPYAGSLGDGNER